MQLERTVKNAFVTAFGLAPGYDVEPLKYGEAAFWDSTAHMVLIAELEAVFDVMMSTEEVIGLSSYHRAVEILSACYSRKMAEV